MEIARILQNLKISKFLNFKNFFGIFENSILKNRPKIGPDSEVLW